MFPVLAVGSVSLASVCVCVYTASVLNVTGLSASLIALRTFDNLKPHFTNGKTETQSSDPTLAVVAHVSRDDTHICVSLSGLHSELTPFPGNRYVPGSPCRG